MEKQDKSKNKILKFLPKALSFHNIPFSPGRDHKRSDNTSRLNKRFSGPLILSIVPHEARSRKSKNAGFETQEPTSPKVSCMGQIKHKKMIHKSKKRASKPDKDQSKPEVKKQPSAIRRFFVGGKGGRKSDGSAGNGRPPVPDRPAPALSQMKRFASSRDALSNFDWMVAQVAPVESDHRSYYSDEERGESEGEEEEVRIPFSAPMVIGGGVDLKPKKEVNLWKRRTLAPPMPLQLNTVVR